MTSGTEDIIYRCKDCSKYNLCCYYHRRKETSQICHYFELPERKTGKWKKILIATVPLTIYGYDCPFCEFKTATDGFNFCPHCGAKMEGWRWTSDRRGDH